MGALIPPSGLMVHEHMDLNDRMSPSTPVKHSHERGEGGHKHPDHGPSFYPYRPPFKLTKRPTGPQLAFVERPSEDAFFDVYLTDSALINDSDGKLRRIRPDDDLEAGPPGYEQAGMSVPERMARRFDLTPRFHDLRTKL